MEPNTNNSSGLRILRNALPAALLAGALTACGGGGGGGGGGDGGGEAAPPPPCPSQTSQGDGFALSSCRDTFTNVFLPIESSVLVEAAGYRLSLVFPPALQSLSGTTDFTEAHRPAAGERNIVGVLRGQAYENPTRTPPYVALTDFFQAWDYDQDTTAPRRLSLTYASFGTWEKFAGSGTEAGFNEGYLGTWVAARPASTQFGGPASVGEYTGFVVGIIGPDGPAGALVQIGSRFGFSGPVTISASGTGVTTGSIDPLKISFEQLRTLRVETLDIKPIAFSSSVGAPPASMTGALSTEAGGAGATLTSGDYEAHYFGAPGNIGQEIAGRIRFKTSNGLIGVGSFGARRQ